MSDPLSPELLDAILAASFGLDSREQGWRVKVLDALEVQWKQTDVPILPWHALRWAVNHGLPIPEWVIQYLCAIADHLKKITLCGGGDHSEAAAVGRALGFGGERGGDDISANALRRDRDFKIAVHVVAEHEIKKGKKTAVFNEVAQQFAVSRATVTNAYKEHREAALAFVNQMEIWLTQKL